MTIKEDLRKNVSRSKASKKDTEWIGKFLFQDLLFEFV